MKPATRDALLRAGLVLAFGLSAGLGVLAFQRWEASGDLSAELDTLEGRLLAGGKKESAEDRLSEVVRDRIAGRYVFASRPEDRFRQVRGVLGNRVLFAGGESASLGEEFDGAEILEVRAESVRFRRDGEEVTVAVGGGGGGEARGGRGERGERGERGGRRGGGRTDRGPRP